MCRLVTIALMTIITIVDGKSTVLPTISNITANKTDIQLTTEDIGLTTTAMLTTEEVELNTTTITTREPKCRFPSTPQHDVALGGKCSDNDRCIAPFSLCNNGTCECQSGFTPEGNRSCVSKDKNFYSCPGGKKFSNPVVCQVYLDLPGVTQPALFPHMPVTNNCPRGFYCVLNDLDAVDLGHCCETPWCPVGLPYLNATCNHEYADDSCNEDTHYCHQVSMNGHIYAELCCPKPCGPHQIWRQNLCLPIRRMGETCELTDQCPTGNLVECRNGICQCPKGHYFDGGSCFLVYCGPPTIIPTYPQQDQFGNPLRCVENVSLCTGKTYCSAIAGYFCCPKPVARCPSTNPFHTEAIQHGKVGCDTNFANSCPSGQMCWPWITVASRTGPNAERLVVQMLGICCPLLQG